MTNYEYWFTPIDIASVGCTGDPKTCWFPVTVPCYPCKEGHQEPTVKLERWLLEEYKEG